MNQPRSIYKTDYVPFDWMENNFSSESNDFCSSENIDECLRHISQELSALGYPSIYSSSSDCGYAVNCDIVRLLNVTFELIGNCRDHNQIKDNLECSNRRLSSDLQALSKKNALLKESLEQSENKYKSVLEKERQLKEKNNRLLQTIKTEKEESKKLSSQILQQKVTYQHEIRKNENTINQMKARLNQIISDRNPDKKVANISPSSLLQRDSKQRGKWKTGSVAKSCVEEMYSSVISSYESRCQEMMKEISQYRICLEQLQHGIVEADLFLGGNSRNFENLTPLSAIMNGIDLQKGLEERFQYLLNKLKETALKIVVQSSEKINKAEKDLLKLRLSSQEKLTGESKSSEQPPVSEEKDLRCNEVSSNFENLSLDTLKEQLEAEKENLRKEKLELSAAASSIEKEKADLAVQKLKVIQLTMQQESPSSQWHQNLNTLASFSVITSKDGSTLVPSTKELKQCLSAPHHQLPSITPLWKVRSFVTVDEKKSKSESTILALKSNLPVETCSTDESTNIASENTNLPRWALAALNSSHPFQAPDVPTICETSIAESASNEELELSTVSSHEQNSELLKAAMEDIERRRNQMS